MKGNRKINAFGHELLVTHNTTFPSYRKLRLPRGSCLSEIVRYTDFVQIHAVCNYVSGLKNRPVIIDIGAHHGAYAILIGRIVRHMKGRVIAVEPNPESFDVLRNNVRLNGLEDVVICEQVAVSDNPGLMHLSMEDVQSHLTAHRSANNVPVNVITLGSLIDKYQIRAVDLLIIDVEGAELPVLKGFPWESTAVNKIFCELHPYAWSDYNYNGDAIKQFLVTRGYLCIDMYLREQTAFDDESYIGPTIFLRRKKFAESSNPASSGEELFS